MMTEIQWRESRILEARREDSTLSREEAAYGLNREGYISYVEGMLQDGASAGYPVARCLAKDGSLAGFFRRHADKFPKFCCAVTGKELPSKL